MGDGIGVGGVEERLLLGRKAGIDEAGEVLGVDLRGLQLLLDGIGLSAFDGFAGGQVLLVLGREARLGVGDDENFVKTVEMGVGLDDDVDEGVAIRIGDDFFNDADGQAAGKDEVAAGGEHLFAGLDALVLENADDFKLAGGVAGENAADAGGFKNDAGAAGLVVDEQDLGGAGKDVADLADDAVGGDDGHVRLQAVVGALVEIEDAGLIAAAGADGLGGEGGVDVAVLEVEEGLEALALAGIFKQGGLLEAQAVDGLLQILVLLADVAQVNVVLPEAGDAQLGILNELLGGRDQRLSPETDETNRGGISGIDGSVATRGTAHLHGKAHDLHHEEGEQYDQAAVAGEERFHNENRD